MDNDIYIVNLMNADILLTTFAFVGDTTISSEAFDQNRDMYLSKLKHHLTVTEDIWQKHSSEHFTNVIMIQDYILPDDTIHTIKLKLFQVLKRKDIGIEDMYLFCETLQTLNVKHIYDILTNNKREPLTQLVMNEFLLNFECISTPIADKEVYSLEEFINDPSVISSCGFFTPLGYNHLQYLFTANPSKVDKFNTDKLLKQEVNYHPNQLLLELGKIKSNSLYLCLSESIVPMHKDKGLEERNSIKLYFPELYQSQIYSLENITSSKNERYDKTITQYATMTSQFTSINAIHDVHKSKKDDLKYIRRGIKECMVLYQSPITFDIPIHLIFKIIHSSNTMPMIKYNPGKKQENLYRLFTGEQIAQNGRKVPILSRPKILQLIKISTSNNSVVCYCIHNEFVLTFEFYSQGDIIIHFTAEVNAQKQPFLKSIQEIEKNIRVELTPILQTINTVISQSGIQYVTLDTIVENPYITVLNILYEYQISIDENMDLTPYINCLSSFLMIESPQLDKGIKITFKRVPNYNNHSEKDKLILNLVHQKKSIREIKHLLTKNFNISIKEAEDAINACLQNAQTELTMFGKQKTKLKDSPGIDILIERQNLSFQTSIIVKNISQIDYLFIIDKYIDVLFFLTQSHDIPIELICPDDLKDKPLSTSPVVEQSRVITSSAGNINDLLYDDEDDDDVDYNVLEEIDEEDEEDEEDNLYLFCYGSNHKEQLEERIGRNDIEYKKASVRNYEIIFGGYSDTWNGAVASIIESNNSICKGAYAIVTEDELDILDSFESNYERQEISIITDTDDDKTAFVYIKYETDWSEHPSTEYLEACYKTIQPFWDDTEIIVKNDQSIVMGTYDSISKNYTEGSALLQAANVEIESSSEPEEEQADAPLQAANVEIESSSEPEDEEQADAPLQASRVEIESSSEEEDEEQADAPLQADDIEIESSSEEEDEEDEEDEDALVQRGGLKKKVDWTGEKLNNPTPFAAYAQELDPDLYLKKKGQKFNKYSSACPSNLKRQPVILTEEEYQELIQKDPEYTLITKDNFDKIKTMDPNQYSKLILKYGSDPENMFYYICPRYWCLSENRPLTQEQVDNNECKGNVIEKGVKKVPKNTFIYSFNSDYNEDPKTGLNTIQMYPGFLKEDVHSEGFCLPCCMKGVIADKYLTRFKPCSEGGIPEYEEKVVKGVQTRILGPDKFPLDNMKYGFLTLSLESFLKIKSTEFQSKDTISVKFNEKCILRRGVHKQDSFISCIALAHSVLTKTEVQKTQDFRKFLAESLTLDQFVEYHNGNLVSIFYKHNAPHDTTIPETKRKAKVLKLKIPNETKEKLIISYNAYKSFLIKQKPLDYEYLWDYICDLLDCNLIILHKSNDDITDRMEVLCPSNAYSTISYVPSKKSLVLYVDNDQYEPIIEYTLYDAKNAKKYKTKTVLDIFFKEKNTHPHIIKLLKDTNIMYQHHCKPVKSTEELVFTQNLLASQLYEYLVFHKYTVTYSIIGHNLKIIGFMVSKNGKRSIVPSYPSNIDIDKPSHFIEDERNWVDYEMTRDFLLQLYSSTKTSTKPIPCNPVSKIIDDSSRIIGLLTMTGQFIQVNPVLQTDISNDSLIPITSQHDYNIEDMVFDKETKGDTTRESFVRNIKLEQGFYISFRNTLKWILSDKKYFNEKTAIQQLIQSKTPYEEKLNEMITLIKSILSEYIVFTSMKDTKKLDQIELCCNKLNKKSCKNTGTFCIFSNSDQLCKLHVPKENLQHNKDNEEMYYIKLADELIRYIHYQQYILNSNNSSILNDIEYKINDNEIIVLESTLLSNYFKNLKPTFIPKNVVNSTYDTTQPIETIEYDLSYYDDTTIQEQESHLEEKQQDIDDVRKSTVPVTSCIKHTKELTAYFQTKKTPFHLIGLKEDLYEHQFTDNCIFILMTEICKLFKVPLYVKAYNIQTKSKFYKSQQTDIIRYITKYILNYNEEGLSVSHNTEKHITLMYKTQGKTALCKKLKENIANFPMLVYSPEYYWTNIDLWIIATKEKLPIILINKSDFFELEHITDPRIKEKNIILLCNNPDKNEYIIIRQDKKTSSNTPYSYGILHKNGNYLLTNDLLKDDKTIDIAIKQYIPLHEWFNSFVPIN